MAEPAFAAECTVTGTDRDDILQGTEADDVICGGGGADTIYGGAGNDRLYGGNSADIVFGGDGDDFIDGENENDSLYGQDGNDVITGRNGADRLDGGNGDDSIDGGNDSDVLQGGAGSDSVVGGSGTDVIDGGPGADNLAGGDGADTTYGGFGNDTVASGRGDDALYGGPGDDTLDGASGKNTCDGGTGANTFASCSRSLDPAGPDPEGEWFDTDTDGLIDAIELRANTDPLAADTDGDGLADGAELLTVTDPLKADTDGNGIADPNDDPDADQLATSDEIARGTKPGDPDTDRDTLTDGREVTLGSDPLAPDSDDDGLSDSDETELGSDLLVADSDGDGVLDGDDSFTKEFAVPDSSAIFQANGLGQALLAVTLAVPRDDRLLDVPGQRAPPVEVNAPLPLESGTLRIPFDKSKVGDEADLAVLHFDETTQTFDKPANQSIDFGTGVAIVTTSTFSPFVLVDVSDFEAIWANEITTPRDGTALTNIDVVLTLDSSGSMTSNDPRGVRKTAAKLFVDALIGGDQAAVVDFDSRAILRQPLTTDFAAVKSAIDRVDSSGGTNLSAGMNAALNELDIRGNPDHERVIVFLTDGEGSYSATYTAWAASSGTVVYTVGLGSGTNTALLGQIASATGGELYQVENASDLPEAFDLIGGDIGAPDADSDGLADTTEVDGWRDGSGRVFRTDPAIADTDADGLTDGEEAGTLLSGGAFGKGTYYGAFSDPTKQDTDGDSLGDLDEVAEGLSAWKADLDNDKLNDAEETQAHNSEAFADDTDVDGYSDPWEIAHQNEGFDPLLFDPTITVLDYVSDFTRGVLCGDIEIGPFCTATTIAFLVGNIASGVIVIGDIRDSITGIVKLDFLSAAFSAAALIPFVGDAAAGIKKYDSFIKAADEIPSGAALRSAMKDVGTPISAKMDLLRKVSPRAVDRLTGVDIPDSAIVRLATRAVSAKHFDDMVSAASDIRKAPSTFRLERDAEKFLRDQTPGALPTQILSEADDRKIKRFYDVYVANFGFADEIKHERASGVGRAPVQATKDAAIVADINSPVSKVTWQFFTSANNTIGPDQRLLDLLGELNLPFILWVA